MFQQMGFGLAVAVLIDATIVRTIIVPAAMELLGDWNWYLPRWLRWIPDVSVEGRRRRRRSPAAPGTSPASPFRGLRSKAPSTNSDEAEGRGAAGAPPLRRPLRDRRACSTASRLRRASPPR